MQVSERISRGTSASHTNFCPYIDLGSGTILEIIRTEATLRPKLIVVPNETLMDNHQTELAKALGEKHFVYSARLNSKGRDDLEKAG
jgi:UDP-N-acetylglucosamine transferase subunit ALG13